MKLISAFCLVAISQILIISPAAAHHGNAAHFDVSKSLTVNGVVTDFAFTNPHTFIYFDALGSNGEPAEWRCETGSATQMRRAGWTQETLLPGQAIEIIGTPALREDNFCYITKLMVEGEEYAVDQAPPNSQKLDAEPTLEIAVDRSATLPNGQPNISGFWVNPHWGANRLAPYPPNGGYVATEAGQIAKNNFDDRYESPALFCKPHNIIRAWAQDAHVNQVSQTEDAVIILNGYMDFERTIHLNQSSHPDNIEPSTAGHSIGRWQGDTLVVDTIGFSAGSIFPRNDVMHSEQMHTIERFRFNPETSFLERSYSVEDPLYLAEVRQAIDYQAISSEPYEPFGCENHNGDNNIRPEDQSGG